MTKSGWVRLGIGCIAIVPLVSINLFASTIDGLSLTARLLIAVLGVLVIFLVIGLSNYHATAVSLKRREQQLQQALVKLPEAIHQALNQQQDNQQFNYLWADTFVAKYRELLEKHPPADLLALADNRQLAQGLFDDDLQLSAEEQAKIEELLQAAFHP